MKWRFLLFFIFNFTILKAQQDAIPLSFIEKLPPVLDFEVLEPISTTELRQQKSRDSNRGNFQFAYALETSFSPLCSGKWIETPSGNVWRLGLKSENAFSLYAALKFILEPEVRLFVYSPDFRQLRGSFSKKNNNEHSALAFVPIAGDEIIFELNLPLGKTDFGEFEIKKIYHDYRNLFSYLQHGADKKNQECNQDVNCENGSRWQTEKHAVVKIISDGGMGTGVLVGNTSESAQPYVLTAHHLLSSPAYAAQAVFVFNLESSSCGENPNTANQSLSGADLVATTDHILDFSLLRLYASPPPSYKPFYVGWDASGTVPDGGSCIHHPFGAPKSIATELHTLSSDDLGQGYALNSTWKVAEWDVGFTEPGSSGAPFFNKEHRLVGVLSGGSSTCSYPKGDYFTKFHLAWDSFSEASTQLKCWLDEAGTGKLVINGYDPFGINTSFCDTAWNIRPTEKRLLNRLDAVSGYVSGHNAIGITQFAESFSAVSNVKLNGMYLHVAQKQFQNPLAHIKVKVWEGEDFPERELYSKTVFFSELQDESVNFIGFDRIIEQTGRFFLGYEINNENQSDTFAVYHAPDRGEHGASTMFLYDGSWYRSAAMPPGIYSSLAIGISACYGNIQKPVPSELRLSPNPARGYLTFELPERSFVNKISCYDMLGKRYNINFRQSEDENMVSFELNEGCYVLKISAGNQDYVVKFLVKK